MGVCQRSIESNKRAFEKLSLKTNYLHKILDLLSLDLVVPWFIGKCFIKATCVHRWHFWEVIGSWICDTHLWISSLIAGCPVETKS